MRKRTLIHAAGHHGELGRFYVRALILLVAAGMSIGGNCGINPGGDGDYPIVTVTLNGVPEGMNDLLVVPASGFVANVTFTQTTSPIDPGSLALVAQRWGDTTLVSIDAAITQLDATGAAGVVTGALALADGSYTVVASIRDTQGRTGYGAFGFAVRDYPSSPPIASNQVLFFDFDIDRDGDTFADFPIDLETFGLGSALDPELSAQVESQVRAAALARTIEAYHLTPTSGLAIADPVVVAIMDTDPGSPGTYSTTRICVGGEDPTGGATIGNILIDPNNSNRTSVECSSLPSPTGIFPRELTAFSGQTAFQMNFSPLIPSLGGTPVGEDPLDPIVLDAGFDYGSAPPAEQARFDDIQTAIDRFSDALGSVMAHEAGHALGLVPPAAPGVGAYGGQAGAEFSHAVTPAGGAPPENYLMKAGNTFTFAKLAGFYGETLPVFRPLNYAYLRDRARTDPTITKLLFPPSISDVTPNVIDTTLMFTVSGSDLVGLPTMQLINPGYTYSVVGEAFIDASTATGWVIQSQIPPGLYDLVYENVDGQSDILVDAVTVQ